MTSDQDEFKLSIGSAGWVRCTSDASEHLVYVRFTPNDQGRWVAREMVIDADGGVPLSAVNTRAPLTRIEARVNGPAHAEITSRWNMPSPAGGPSTGSNVAVLASYFANLTTKRSPLKDTWLDAAVVGAGTIVKRRPTHRGSAQTPSTYRLTSGPTGSRRLSDDFLASVARAYYAADERGESITATLASDAGTDTRTIERWVGIARKRKIMRPARGKGARG
jgi:hypothetical protein